VASRTDFMSGTQLEFQNGYTLTNLRLIAVYLTLN
jgi:hypothetical protein